MMFSDPLHIHGRTYTTLILKATYFTGYADNNTPFVVKDNIANVTKALEEIGENILN